MKRFLFLLLSLVLLCSTAFAASNGGEIVYITRTGECYHSGGCRYLSNSKIEITLADAVARGYRRCSRCNPPRLVEYTPKPTPRQTATPGLRSVATPAPTWRAQDDITAAYQAARNAEKRQTERPTATPEPEKNKEYDAFDTLFIIFVLGGILVPLIEGCCAAEIKQRRQRKKK